MGTHASRVSVELILFLLVDDDDDGYSGGDTLSILFNDKIYNGVTSNQSQTTKLM